MLLNLPHTKEPGAHLFRWHQRIPSFHITMKRGGLEHAKWKGSDWLLLKERAGGKSWGMDVWYAARQWII